MSGGIGIVVDSDGVVAEKGSGGARSFFLSNLPKAFESEGPKWVFCFNVIPDLLDPYVCALIRLDSANFFEEHFITWNE